MRWWTGKGCVPSERVLGMLNQPAGAVDAWFHVKHDRAALGSHVPCSDCLAPEYVRGGPSARRRRHGLPRVELEADERGWQRHVFEARPSSNEGTVDPFHRRGVRKAQKQVSRETLRNPPSLMLRPPVAKPILIVLVAFRASPNDASPCPAPRSVRLTPQRPRGTRVLQGQ